MIVARRRGDSVKGFSNPQICQTKILYSVSLSSSGSDHGDVSTQAQLLSVRNLELLFANKRATSLPGDGETEYR